MLGKRNNELKSQKGINAVLKQKGAIAIHSMAKVPFWFSTEHQNTALMAFWFSAVNMYMIYACMLTVLRSKDLSEYLESNSQSYFGKRSNTVPYW